MNKPAKQIVKFQGMLTEVVFAAADSHFKILKVGGKTIKGQIREALVGAMYEFEGWVGNDERFGNKFLMVTKYEMLVDTTPHGIINYLSSMGVGIGYHTGEKLFLQYGKDTLEVLESAPLRVAKEVPGISENVALATAEILKKERWHRDLKKKLYGAGLTENQIAKIIAAYPNDTFSAIKKDCFKLTSIKGFGFVIVSKIAELCSVPHEDPQRIAAGITYAFESYFTEGHVCVRRTDIVRSACELLGVHQNMVDVRLQQMLTDKQLASHLQDWRDFKPPDKELEDFDMFAVPPETRR